MSNRNALTGLGRKDVRLGCSRKPDQLTVRLPGTHRDRTTDAVMTTNGGYEEGSDYSRSHWHKWQVSATNAPNPKLQSTIQCPCFLVRVARLRRATRVAYWKTSRTPSPDLAEHSRYCLAPIFCATAIPYKLVSAKTLDRDLKSHTSSGVTGRWLVFLRFSMVFGSRRRSFLQPTRIIGRPAQKCITSEIH